MAVREPVVTKEAGVAGRVVVVGSVTVLEKATR